MRTCFYRILIVILLILSSRVSAQISDTTYDFSSHAFRITKGCKNQLEQARNIYLWLCDNIAYDTQGRIFTADECWENGKGVCQAYCELFYRLSEPLELKTTVVFGKSKDREGNIETRGHSWIQVEADGNLILIDPTWGAGTVDDQNRFVRSNRDMSWFQTDPHWFIFTHYPDRKRDQMLKKPVKWEQFLNLPPLCPSLGSYGWNGEEVLNNILNGNIQSLPYIFEENSASFDLLGIPMDGTLKPGQFYTFKIRKKTADEIALIHNGELVHESEWEQEGNEYTLRYMPVAEGSLKLSASTSDGVFKSVLSYDVQAPTEEELKIIEEHFPFKTSEMQAVKNLSAEDWELIGFTGKDLLERVRKEKITALPLLFADTRNCLRKADIPLSETLVVGKEYTFSFVPQKGMDWQIINGDQWYADWSTDEETGRLTLTVIPGQAGELHLSARYHENDSYHAMLSYQVVSE